MAADGGNAGSGADLAPELQPGRDVCPEEADPRLAVPQSLELWPR